MTTQISAQAPFALTIGKTYRNGHGDLRHISGKHNATTFEFEKGRNFQDSLGAFYHLDGTCQMTNHLPTEDDNLVEEIEMFVDEETFAKLNASHDRHVYTTEHRLPGVNIYSVGSGGMTVRV